MEFSPEKMRERSDLSSLMTDFLGKGGKIAKIPERVSGISDYGYNAYPVKYNRAQKAAMLERSDESTDFLQDEES